MSIPSLPPSLPPRVPLEIMDEIIGHAWDCPSTLAAWCSVSKRSRCFALALLHWKVVLNRPEGLMSFLPRLLTTASSSHRPSLPSNSIYYFEILALPSQREASVLFDQLTKSTLALSNMTLRIGWNGWTKERVWKSFWIPSLLLLLQPKEFQEIGTKNLLTLSGPLLAFYLRCASQWKHFPEFLTDLYNDVLELFSRQQRIDRSLATCDLAFAVRMKGRSSSLDKIVSDVERIRAWFEGQSVLEESQDRERTQWTIVDVRSHLFLEESKLGFLESAWKKMVLENDRLAEARRRAQEYDAAAIAVAAAAATAAAAAAALVAPRPPPQSSGRQVPVPSARDKSPIDEAVTRYGRILGFNFGSGKRDILTIPAPPNTSPFLKHIPTTTPTLTLPPPRLNSRVEIPTANASDLATLLLPYASSSRHIKAVDKLATFLTLPDQILSRKHNTSEITKLVNGQKKRVLPQSNNSALGSTPDVRTQTMEELKNFRKFFVWMLCEEVRSELVRRVEEEEGRRREFEALLGDPAVRRRFHSGFSLLQDLENLLQWVLKKN
ncbi:hypothetical protein BDY24DRAFT_392454 [Mrakia frigida]|uniref:uncharacterized protein n=1 Tax=Mrakia frigida TaxID=29902 RepID=UPI003FCC1696